MILKIVTLGALLGIIAAQGNGTTGSYVDYGNNPTPAYNGTTDDGYYGNYTSSYNNTAHYGFYENYTTSPYNVTSSVSSTTSSSACESNNFQGWGTIQSPNFPNNYPNYARCEVTIRTDPGTRIRLTFKTFGIESATDCRYDSLVIRDGDNSYSRRIRNLCGSNLPRPVVSSGNAFFVEFASDASVTGQGFRIEWSAVNSSRGWNDTVSTTPGYNSDLSNLTTIWDFNASNNGTTDGGYYGNYSTSSYNYTTDYGYYENYTTSSYNVSSSVSSTSSSSACESNDFQVSGTIQSPNFPNNYPNYARCEVTIRTDPGTRIELTFRAFSIENASGCRYDSLVIRDGDSSFSRRTRNLCGSNLPGPVVSSSNTLFLEFSSDASVTSQGFKIEWSAVNSSSGWNDTVSTTSGYDSDLSNLTSIWDFNASTNSLGLNSTGYPYTEGTTYQSILSFTDCGGDLVGNNGTLTSPNYPSNYPNSARCVWTITTDRGTRVRLSFNDFQLEGSEDCIFDSLTIVDGNSNSSSILQKLCNHSLPDPVESSGNSLYLEFRTDMSVSLDGFSVRWTAVEDSANQNRPTPTANHGRGRKNRRRGRGRGRPIRE